MPKFYSVKPNALVTRLGTKTYIGAQVDVERNKEGAPIVSSMGEPTTKVVYTDEIVMISDGELARYGREYAKLEREGSLILKEEKDFKAYQDKLADESKKEGEALEHQAKEREAEAKKQADAQAAEEKKQAAEREAEAKKAAAKAKAESKS
jgi:hypothetical protein